MCSDVTYVSVCVCVYVMLLATSKVLQHINQFQDSIKSNRL